MLFFGYIFTMESLRKNKNNDRTCFFSAFTLAVSLGSSLNPQSGGLGFKQLPQEMT